MLDGIDLFIYIIPSNDILDLPGLDSDAILPSRLVFYYASDPS